MLNAEDTKIAADKLLSQIFHMPINSLVRVPFKEDDGEGLLLVKRQVGSGQYVYAMHSPSPNDHTIYFDFAQIGIIAKNKFYLMKSGVIPYDIYKILLEKDNILSFQDAYEKASSVQIECDILKDFRAGVSKKLDKNALRFAHLKSLDSIFKEARKSFFESYPKAPLFFERQAYLSTDDFAGVLCGVKDASEVIKEAALQNEDEADLVYLAQKMEESLKNHKLIEDWELAMLDVLTKCKEKGRQSVIVSFENKAGKEKTPFFKIDIEKFLTSLSGPHHYFMQGDLEPVSSPPVPVHMLFSEEYGYFGMPRCEDVTYIKCKGEELYRKPEKEEELER